MQLLTLQCGQKVVLGRCSSVSHHGRSSVKVMAMGTQMGAPRRQALLALTSVPMLSMMQALPALALIPDDDDEEMVEKAKANRKKRLAGEKKAEKAFSRSEGFVDNTTKKGIASVQIAVNSLAKAGEALASGNVNGASSVLSGAWVSDFSEVVTALSIADDTKTAGGRLMDELKALQSAAGSGSLENAKKEYVDTVSALSEWVKKAELSGLKGL